MIIKSAAFVTSAVRPAQYPVPDRPEIAFAGRSNVGKSSLINRLVRRKRLAKTSSTPGRTQLINFFDINSVFYLVDLPGYGFAKVPAAVKKKWGPMVETYLTGRKTLRAVFLLMDIRREPGPEDRQMLTFLDAAGVSRRLVITKSDKVSRNRRQGLVSAIQQRLALAPEHVVVASAKTGEGMEQLREMIDLLVQKEGF